MTYDVFISYSRKDTSVADEICRALDKNGITYFIDRKGIGGGMEFPAVISDAIINSKIILFLGSENSYKSKFTNSEITFAFNEKPKGTIVPYIIDGSPLPNSLKFTFSSINIRTKEEHPIETTLMKDLFQLLEKDYVDLEQNDKDSAMKGVNDAKMRETGNSNSCCSFIPISWIVIGFFAYWLREFFDSVWVIVGIIVLVIWFLFLAPANLIDIFNLFSIKDKEKRKKEKTEIIRTFVTYDMAPIFIFVAIFVGYKQSSVWLGLLTWIIPTFVTFYFSKRLANNKT